MKSNTQDTRSIEDIIKSINDGKLLLPEFQRDFKWPIEKSEILFDSIFQNLFIGSLIVSMPKFDLVCKGFDMRERGSKGRKPTRKLITAKEFEHQGIYTLLDGQQRTTAIYRALMGIDSIYLIFKDFETLLSDKFYSKQENKILTTFDQYIEGFDSIKPKENIFYLKIGDLYKYMNQRETKFDQEVISPTIKEFNLSLEEKDILREYGLSLFSDFKSDIIRKSNLLSVQLLDMDLEKFCLYFERSNSQGLNLSFTDIITAKIYIDFKLSEKIEEAKEKYTHFSDKIVDYIVRYINFLANGEVTKKSILKDLKGQHFQTYWDEVVKDVEYVQNWLESNKWLFRSNEIPYTSMLLPILSFYQNLPKKEFSQATNVQLNQLKYWFYASILDNRYGGARHGSTNVVIKSDCEMLSNLAKGINPPKEYWNNFRVEYSFEEFLKIDSNSNAKFLGINYYMWSISEFKNFENSAIVSIKNNIEVHHFFPVNYLKNNFGKDSEEFNFSDSLLNKVRINKFSNIKINDKSPSSYLKEIELNSGINLELTLSSHYIPDVENLKNGNYDNDYMGFLHKRYIEIAKLLDKIKYTGDSLKEGNVNNLW